MCLSFVQRARLPQQWRMPARSTWALSLCMYQWLSRNLLSSYASDFDLLETYKIFENFELCGSMKRCCSILLQQSKNTVLKITSKINFLRSIGVFHCSIQIILFHSFSKWMFPVAVALDASLIAPGIAPGSILVLVSLSILILLSILMICMGTNAGCYLILPGETRYMRWESDDEHVVPDSSMGSDSIPLERINSWVCSSQAHSSLYFCIYANKGTVHPSCLSVVCPCVRSLQPSIRLEQNRRAALRTCSFNLIPKYSVFIWLQL